MRILNAHLGEALRHPADVWGDLWTSTWSADGQMYVASDDTNGFGHLYSSNLALNRLDGSPPNLTGVNLNAMEAYGHSSELGPDQAHWKASGLTSVDGVLYLSVSRMFYPDDPFWVQDAFDASIIASHDHGLTWSPMPTLGQAMFPGHTFATPYFVDFGQDGPGHGAWPDGGDTYVYAVSSNGVWNNGATMTLGRVRRDRIGRLDPQDWEFAHGYRESGATIMTQPSAPIGAPSWRPRHDTARPIFRAPGQTSMTGIHYIAPLGLYILPQWHFPHLERDNPARWQESQWDFYQAEHPWGPWSLFHTQTFAPEGFYNPTIPAKFISDDGTRMWILTCGDCGTAAYYRLYLIPLELRVAA